jgi:hypothetical protein
MALLPIFCVARFSRTNLSRIVARALKFGKIADGGMPPTYETMHQMRAECRSVTDGEHQFLTNTKKNRREETLWEGTTKIRFLNEPQ